MNKIVLLIIIAVIGVSTLVAFDRLQVNHWEKERSLELRTLTHLIRVRLESSLRARFNAIEGVASLFIINQDTKPDEFAEFARNTLKYNPAIRALQYADPKTRVTYVYPPKGNEIVIKKPMLLLADPKRGPYVRKAIDRKTATLQGPFPLRQGGMGVVVRSPIFKDDKFLGLAIGVYDIPILIEEALSGIDSDKVIINLVDNAGQTFYGQNNISINSYEKSIPAVDTEWKVFVAWNRDPISPLLFSRVVIWLFGAGFFIAVFFVVYMIWKQAASLEIQVKERTEELFNINKKLSYEIAEHTKDEDELRLRSEELEKINKAFVGRELKMAEMKKEIEELKKNK